MVAIASGLDLNTPGNLINNHVELHAPQAYCQESSTQQPPFEVALAEEPLFGFDAAMEMEYEIDADSCKMHPCIAVFRTNMTK